MTEFRRILFWDSQILGEHRGVMLGRVLGEARQQVERSVDVIASVVDETSKQKTDVDRDLIEVDAILWLLLTFKYRFLLLFN